jgi:hypothetical protein
MIQQQLAPRSPPLQLLVTWSWEIRKLAQQSTVQLANSLMQPHALAVYKALLLLALLDA